MSTRRSFRKTAPFPEPAALLITPDHYLFRMLFSQGISLESLGVPARDPKAAIERDPRKVWRIFAANYQLFRGTPSRAWLDYELHELFGVRERLGADSADRIYDQIDERLKSPEFRPRALFDSFNIEVLATTDAATDELLHHRAIRASGWNGRVVPTFRPDALFRLAAPAWRERARHARARARGDHRQLRRLPCRARRAPRGIPSARRVGHRSRRRGAIHGAAHRPTLPTRCSPGRSW